MTGYRVAAVLASLVIAPAALAQTSAPAPSTTVSPVAVEGKNLDDKARVVCKRIAPTGSRTPGKRICRTAGEWAAEEHAAKESLDDASRRALQSAPKM
ncbi:MAG TPA: hypothetical protein VEA44_04390 [Caulobacter sp.]|nr:hypothetical protein [Caulobacter sp.]